MKPETEQGDVAETAQHYVARALANLKKAAELTTDPGLQGDLERSRAKLQRRLDLTQGL